MSEAKCVTGWGVQWTTRSPHPAAHFIRGDPPPLGEGEDHTAILRCRTGAPEVTPSAASMMELASSP